MHEFSFASHIASVVMDNVKKNAVSKVISVNVEVGQFTMIIPDTLEYCYDIVKESYPELQGSKMVVTIVPGTVKCNDCGATTTVKLDPPPETSPSLPVLHASMFTCEKCGKSNTSIAGGRDALIKSMKVDG